MNKDREKEASKIMKDLIMCMQKTEGILDRCDNCVFSDNPDCMVDPDRGCMLEVKMEESKKAASDWMAKGI